MKSVNQTTLIGHLGKDAEVRTFQNGDRVASFSVATKESWKDKSGEWKDRVEWHSVSVLNQNLVKFAEKLRKGNLVYVQGQNETRSYEKDGSKKYITEVVLRPFRGDLGLLERHELKDEQQEPYQAETKAADFDDEIPF